MSKIHSGNHGLHKFRKSRYFIGGGKWFLLLTLLILAWGAIAILMAYRRF